MKLCSRASCRGNGEIRNSICRVRIKPDWKGDSSAHQRGGATAHSWHTEAPRATFLSPRLATACTLVSHSSYELFTVRSGDFPHLNMHHFLLEMTRFPIWKNTNQENCGMGSTAPSHNSTDIFISNVNPFRFVCVDGCVQNIHKKEMLLENRTSCKCAHHRRKYLN